MVIDVWSPPVSGGLQTVLLNVRREHCTQPFGIHRDLDTQGGASMPTWTFSIYP